MVANRAGGTSRHPRATTSRFQFERCITGRCQCHDEPPSQPARGVALTLATYADADDGRIPAQYSPSLTSLARAAGFARSTTAAALAQLDEDGWIDRTPPPVGLARSEKARTRYRLTVPSPGDGLVRNADQSESRSSPPDGPELVRDTDLASPGDGHNHTLQSLPSTARETDEHQLEDTHTVDGAIPDDPHYAAVMARAARVAQIRSAS